MRNGGRHSSENNENNFLRILFTDRRSKFVFLEISTEFHKIPVCAEVYKMRNRIT